VLQIPTLTQEEEAILEHHYRKSNTPLIRERAHAILLNNEGRSAAEIAAILRRTENTVRDWIHAYAQTRIASIFPKYTGNTNASKLTKEQLQEIQETLAKPPSSQEGSLPSAFWDVQKLRSYVSAQYGVVYESDRSYHHIFAVFNFSFKFPEGFDQRMLEIQGEIEQKQQEGYLIFFADECSLCWETEYRRAWLPKGEKTILKVNREKLRQNYFGALNMESKKEELVELDWQNTETMIGALRDLTKMYPHQKLCIVWDNARWHRSKDLRELLGDGKEFAHIRFIWLPPYAPDKNPQEHVWKMGKRAVKNTVTETFDELKKIFETSLRNKKFDYKML
jgi:transposase